MRLIYDMIGVIIVAAGTIAAVTGDFAVDGGGVATCQRTRDAWGCRTRGNSSGSTPIISWSSSVS